MSSCKRRGGLEQASWRIVHSQSALAIRDVMCLAMPTPRAEELASIYEWYAARTTSAIRTSYAAATTAVGALLAYLNTDRNQGWTIALYGFVILLALVACLFQQSELAQLPRERAVAMHLLSIFEQLAPANAEPPLLKTPIVQPEGQRFWTRQVRVTLSVALITLAILIVVLWKALPAEDLLLAKAGLVLFGLVALVFVMRIAAEIRPSHLPSCNVDAFEDIGGVRLDDYVSDPEITKFVNKHIESAMREVCPARRST